ncbi:MAG: CvpA family protein [Candidatus Adiutrix sp.]|nr:CvpA family protein [Candidatus Adiutrix sp.]
MDIALLVLLAYFLLRGLLRGVVKEVVAVLGLFVAFWVAGIYWPLGGEHLKPIFDLAGQRGVTSFILIFVVVYFLISLISIFVDKIVKLTISPVVSALLGMVAGVVKGILVCGILLAGAETFLKPTEKFFTESKIWPYLQPVTDQAKAWMPEALRAAMYSKNKTVGEQRGPGQPEPLKFLSLDSVDWKSIQNLLNSNPELISPAWRDKLRNISGPEGLSAEDLKRFISDNPNLFVQPPAPAGPAGTAPSWPQPAND